jgi:hypothetical protein
MSETLILNSMCKHLPSLCQALEELVAAVKPVHGVHLLDKKVIKDCHGAIALGFETISVTYVCFHLQLVFPHEKGPKNVEHVGKGLRSQLQDKGAWLTLPDCLRRAIGKLITD